MDRVIEYANYARLILGGLLLLAMFVGRRLRAAAEFVERARNDLGDDICRHGVCPDECPSCRPMPAVVASSDLDPLEALYRAPAFAGERSFRTPGEGR